MRDRDLARQRHEEIDRDKKRQRHRETEVLRDRYIERQVWKNHIGRQRLGETWSMIRQWKSRNIETQIQKDER